ncbi:cysteine desulfurase [Jidongwangia harbinensis]|uniref:cysteine desulfurase n=1 Tax=Jidongwangia harbinensis TaxID=2878561 RepID=UPI001CD983A5|nr:cysteine desulfurase [Jidongwangia harbinensis]MCA2212256.1 cysteine desulfurase [Jidongwangia harbinensis]
MSSFDVARVRADFPILGREINGHPLVYLDSANTSQKPVQVLDVMRAHAEQHNANVSRSVHTLGTESTAAYEDARAKVATFIGAASPDEVVFTKNSTEALNLVAHSAGEMLGVGPGDEIVISEMEHHSNIVPWQLLCRRTGATLRWFGVTDDGRLDESTLDELVNERTKIVSLVHMSNILGTINDVSRIVARAHQVGALVLLDCSQSVPHLPLSVSALGADFIAFTGHKMVGPTGIGVLWGRGAVLADLPPFLGGGSMIETVTLEHTTFAAPPARFEAGTPPITEAIGLGAAVDYLSAIGMDEIHRHEQEITGYALKTLADLPGVRVFGLGTPEGRGGTVSFDVDGIHPHDVGQILDDLGVQVRVGHHCARPVCARFGVAAMTRASFYLYTTTDEIDALARGIEQVRRVFG